MFETFCFDICLRNNLCIKVCKSVHSMNNYTGPVFKTVGENSYKYNCLPRLSEAFSLLFSLMLVGCCDVIIIITTFFVGID